MGRTTKRIMMMSKRWQTAVEGFSVEEMAAKGPMDVDAWDEDTHKAVQAWALGNTDEVPGVISVYLGQFKPRDAEEVEVWGNEIDRPLAAAHENQRTGLNAGYSACDKAVGKDGDDTTRCEEIRDHEGECRQLPEAPSWVEVDGEALDDDGV